MVAFGEASVFGRAGKGHGEAAVAAGRVKPRLNGCDPDVVAFSELKDLVAGNGPIN